MPTKDYYAILAVSSSASAEQIKKAFRQLALRYHPDKNPHDPQAAYKFEAIHTAYNTLSDPKKRAAYNFERYLANPLYANKPAILSAADVVEAAGKILQSIEAQNPYNIDRDVLFFRLQDLLSDSNLEMLRRQNDVSANGQFMHTIFRAAKHLSHHQAKDILDRLKSLYAGNRPFEKEIDAYHTQLKHGFYWEEYKGWIALAIAIVTCLLIFKL